MTAAWVVQDYLKETFILSEDLEHDRELERQRGKGKLFQSPGVMGE